MGKKMGKRRSTWEVTSIAKGKIAMGVKASLALSLLLLAPACVGAAQSNLPDLVITELSLDPDTPTQGEVVRVLVGVYNTGTAESGAFTLEWRGGDGFARPSCTWWVMPIVPRGGLIFECTWFYASWYASIRPIATADSEGEVHELNEQNNSLSLDTQVLRP